MHQTMSEKISHSTLTLSQAGREYLKVGLLSFGGPAAQIALMHKVFVEDRKWLTEKQYLSALNFCMLLPVAVSRCLQTGSLTMGKRVFWPSVPQKGGDFWEKRSTGA